MNSIIESHFIRFTGLVHVHATLADLLFEIMMVRLMVRYHCFLLSWFSHDRDLIDDVLASVCV